MSKKAYPAAEVSDAGYVHFEQKNFERAGDRRGQFAGEGGK